MQIFSRELGKTTVDGPADIPNWKSRGLQPVRGSWKIYTLTSAIWVSTGRRLVNLSPSPTQCQKMVSDHQRQRSFSPQDKRSSGAGCAEACERGALDR